MPETVNQILLNRRSVAKGGANVRAIVKGGANSLGVGKGGANKAQTQLLVLPCQ